MKEIKIGDYARTYKGTIAKVVAYQEIRTFTNKYDGVSFYGFDTDKGNIAKCDIKNHNENIIELLEVGDYVNGYKVVEIDEYKPIGDVLQKYLKVDCSRLLNAIYSEQIKTILTKEQMEANCYRLEV